MWGCINVASIFLLLWAFLRARRHLAPAGPPVQINNGDHLLPLAGSVQIPEAPWSKAWTSWRQWHWTWSWTPHKLCAKTASSPILVFYFSGDWVSVLPIRSERLKGREKKHLEACIPLGWSLSISQQSSITEGFRSQSSLAFQRSWRESSCCPCGWTPFLQPYHSVSKNHHPHPLSWNWSENQGQNQVQTLEVQIILSVLFYVLPENAMRTWSCPIIA